MSPAAEQWSLALGPVQFGLLAGLALSLVARPGHGRHAQLRRHVALLLLMAGAFAWTQLQPAPAWLVQNRRILMLFLLIQLSLLYRDEFCSSSAALPAAGREFGSILARIMAWSAAPVLWFVWLYSLWNYKVSALLDFAIPCLPGALAVAYAPPAWRGRRSAAAALLLIAVLAGLHAELDADLQAPLALTLSGAAAGLRFCFRRRVRADRKAQQQIRRQAVFRRMRAQERQRTESAESASLAMAILPPLIRLRETLAALAHRADAFSLRPELLAILDRSQDLYSPLELVVRYQKRHLGGGRLRRQRLPALWATIAERARAEGIAAPVLRGGRRAPEALIDGELFEEGILQLCHCSNHPLQFEAHPGSTRLVLHLRSALAASEELRKTAARRLLRLAGAEDRGTNVSLRILLPVATQDQAKLVNQDEERLRLLASLGFRAQAESLAVSILRRRPWRRRSLEEMLLGPVDESGIRGR